MTQLHTFARRTLVIVCAAFGLTAGADVTLENRVQKLEHFVDEVGARQVRLAEAEKVIPGDELRYTIVFSNRGAQTVDAGSVVITNPLPASTEYIDGTAFGAGTEITFSVDDGTTFANSADLTVVRDGREAPASSADYTAIRWTFAPALEPGATSHVWFNVRLK